ncbi:MAG: nucleoside-diphosphate kinase [Bacillota bacterium]|jgi:nucleoside-diphosphate kinase|nr:nucleoside-diphosphate kinase [Bacillota bacterium]MDK2924372.1 nucleoside-diphosphate kinase [Bacillota bacterium]
MEQTLVLVKPDGVRRGLIGEVLRRLERQGLKICGLKLLCLSPELAAEHYSAHRGKPFYEELIAFITSGPVVAAAVAGEDAVARVRRLVGDTRAAAPGTIRGDFATSVTANVVHASESPESAAREIRLFFSEDELH